MPCIQDLGEGWSPEYDRSINKFCAPNFNSFSRACRLLDNARHGYFIAIERMITS